MKPSRPARIASIAAGTAAAGGLGALATSRSVDTWYRDLDRPSWNPPDKVFGPVWTLLYAQMAVAASRVANADAGAKAVPMTLYGSQLALNAGWSVVFFGLRRPRAALAEMAALWVAVAATTASFGRRDRKSAMLMLPYLAWTTFAFALNADIARRNP